MGLTRRGKGTKVMMVADSGGTPLATLVDSPSKEGEVKLAEVILEKVKVPDPKAAPGKGPSAWWRTRGMTAWPCAKA